MAELKKNKTKKGFTTLETPYEQPNHCVSREYKNWNVLFFKNPETKKGEAIISKNIRKDYATGVGGEQELVQDFTHDDVVEHFKKLGYKIKEAKQPSTFSRNK